MKSFNLTRYSVTHPIGIFMIVLFFVVLGLYSYWRIGVELYPNINVPYVIVSVRYDGADAESVEQQITKPLEDALSSVSNVKHITSKSRTGRSDVTLELNFDADADAAAIDASEKVNRIRRKLPDDADDPVQAGGVLPLHQSGEADVPLGGGRQAGIRRVQHLWK